MYEYVNDIQIVDMESYQYSATRFAWVTSEEQAKIKKTTKNSIKSHRSYLNRVLLALNLRRILNFSMDLITILVHDNRNNVFSIIFFSLTQLCV